MTVDPRSFRNALACFASGVTVVTAAAADGRRVGVTVSAFSSLSLDPPLIQVCLDRRTGDLDLYRTGPFAVNILHENQKDVSIRFATRDGDRWANLKCRPGQNGAPIIEACLAEIECDVDRVLDGGDHVIIVGRVTRTSSAAGGSPLLYFRSGYHTLGPTPPGS